MIVDVIGLLHLAPVCVDVLLLLLSTSETKPQPPAGMSRTTHLDRSAWGRNVSRDDRQFFVPHLAAKRKASQDGEYKTENGEQNDNTRTRFQRRSVRREDFCALRPAAREGEGKAAVGIIRSISWSRLDGRTAVTRGRVVS